MNEPARRFPELLVPSLFWDLPVEEEDVPLICPILYSHQPPWFMDAQNQKWLGVLTSTGLKRKRYVCSPVLPECIRPNQPHFPLLGADKSNVILPTPALSGGD